MTIEDLDFIEQTEFDNPGELLGIDGADMNAELLGILNGLDAVKRQRVLNSLKKRKRPSRKSRGEMEKFFRLLPKHIRQQLRKGQLRLADYVIYSIKPATQKTIKFFEPQDDKNIGLRNISNAKLPKNHAFMCSGIIMLAGAGADSTEDVVKSNEYKEIEAENAIANGEFSLKANKVQIVPDTSNRVFCSKQNTFNNLGYYKLDNPRLIKDEEPIEFTVELGTLTGITAHTHIWTGLVGTITTP